MRVELRVFERGEPNGSIYAARPISIVRPLWRVDLLQDTNAAPNTLDRAHHHPHFAGWDPGPRVFVEELSSDPLAWLTRTLGDVSSLLKETSISPAEIPASDVDALRTAAPEITDTVRRLLQRVWSGELARPTEGTGPEAATSARVSWL
ncbi:hypothetical protein GCM10010289_85290 [Streptomyces violascens]|uniref:Uncharacterized protein n=1 Tax=Streptomyces violascens TaxID=67381 RepID=A0ABQ3QSY4_9ACTN|nr:hypothetical protein GCM10010289_85290 [Streptomyces violascens]GHI40339.1 hypothetical protein Sviol_47470 [Streptomyces violascens]